MKWGVLTLLLLLLLKLASMKKGDTEENYDHGNCTESEVKKIIAESEGVKDWILLKSLKNQEEALTLYSLGTPTISLLK